MKNRILTLLAALAVCAAAFAGFYVANDVPAIHRAARDHDAMTWLRTEFRLDDAQFAAIKKLHDDYSSVCGEHCAAINAAKSRHASAAEVAALEKTCVDAMTAHFHRVAAQMAPAEGSRYLTMVLPRVTAYDHAQAPSVRRTP